MDRVVVLIRERERRDDTLRQSLALADLCEKSGVERHVERGERGGRHVFRRRNEDLRSSRLEAGSPPGALELAARRDHHGGYRSSGFRGLACDLIGLDALFRYADFELVAIGMPNDVKNVAPSRRSSIEVSRVVGTNEVDVRPWIAAAEVFAVPEEAQRSRGTMTPSRSSGRASRRSSRS